MAAPATSEHRDAVARAALPVADVSFIDAYVSLLGFESLERGVRTALAATLTAPMHAEAAHRALPWIPSPEQPLISWCTMGATSRLTVTMVAEALRVSDRTLYRLMRGLHLPTPEARSGGAGSLSPRI